MTNIIYRNIKQEVVFLNKKKGKNTLLGKLDSKYWVQKSNPLAAMIGVPFSLGELKILDTYISRIDIADENQRTVRFSKEEYEKLMGIKCANYRALRKHARGMLSKVVTLKMPDNRYMDFVLFSKALYFLDENGTPQIELSCSEEARDLFFCFGKHHYFKYALENVIRLSRVSSYLLYLYVCSNSFRKTWEVSLDELRDVYLNCKDNSSYKDFKIFKRDVFTPAAKEVNEKTNCLFDCEPVKNGRKVVAIKFICKSAPLLPKMLEVENLEQKVYEDEPDYGSELTNLIACACDYEFDEVQVRFLQDLVLKNINTHDHIVLHDYLMEKYHKMNVYNPQKGKRFSYLCSILENDQ